MTTVRSTRHPSLHVADIDVQFKDGVAKVTGKKKLDRLRELGSYGVIVDPDEAEDAPDASDPASDEATGGE